LKQYKRFLSIGKDSKDKLKRDRKIEFEQNMEELFVLKKHMYQIMDCTDDMLAFVDLDFKYRTVNNAYIKTFQIEYNDIVGKHVKEMVGDEYFYSFVKPNLEKVFNGEIFKYETWVDLPKMGREYLFVSYKPSVMKNGRINGAIITATNLTETKRQLEEKELQQKLLLQQAKMANIGEMIAFISHQWRQPLQIVSAYMLRIRLIAEKLNQSERLNVTEYIDKAEATLEQLSEMIDGLYEFYNNSEHKEPVNIKKTLERAIGIVYYRVQSKNIAINININGSLATVCRKNDFLHILLVLINNAIDALMEINNDRVLNIDTKEYKDKIELVFADNAGGIDEAIALNIFNPGFTTKKTGEGYGLYFSKKIAEESMGAEILFRPNDIGGSTFIVILPTMRKA